MKTVRRDVTPAKSHDMGPWHADIRAPAGEPRFYTVRKCTDCGGEEIKHPAGHFMDDELLEECQR